MDPTRTNHVEPGITQRADFPQPTAKLPRDGGFAAESVRMRMVLHAAVQQNPDQEKWARTIRGRLGICQS